MIPFKMNFNDCTINTEFRITPCLSLFLQHGIIDFTLKIAQVKAFNCLYSLSWGLQLVLRQWPQFVIRWIQPINDFDKLRTLNYGSGSPRTVPLCCLSSFNELNNHQVSLHEEDIFVIPIASTVVTEYGSSTYGISKTQYNL